MDLKYDDIKTFLDIYKAGTFSQASRELGLSQSALSQKVARLEEVLQTTLFVRHPRSLSLTSSGEQLLVYAKDMVSMQKDFLSRFNQYDKELSGVIRIAGFSSVMRSIIIPKLSKFIRDNEKVNIEFSSHEMYELEEVLKSNRADFIITDYEPSLMNVEQYKIMEEEYVIIESKKHKNIPDKFLDHHQHDNATESYLKFIGNTKVYERGFMGDVYSIVDGVAHGLGRAVMSHHIVKDDKRFKIIKGKKKYTRPVMLSHRKQNYYGPLFREVLELLKSGL